jgi:rubredoxin
MYRTGETPEPGRYQCLVCGTRVDIEAGQPLPRCPYCHGTGFHHVHD